MPSSVARWRVSILLAFALATGGMLAASDGPFERGWLGHNGARYALIARNHERLGLMHLNAAPLLDAGVPDPAQPQVYAHHPPALGLCIALLFRAVGESDNAARAVPIAATLLMLLLFARLLSQVAGPVAAAFGTLAAVAQPMISVYGSHVDVQGTPVLCLSLATLCCYRRWLLGSSVWPVLLCAAAASAFDWYGLYMPALCALHLLVMQPGRRAAALGLAAFTVGLFAAWVAWLLSLPGISLETLRSAAGVRGAGALAAAGADIGMYVGTWMAGTLALMPAWPGLVLLAIVVCLRDRGAVSDDGRDHLRDGSGTADADAAVLGTRGLVTLLLAAPLLHGLLFPAGLLQHSYWLFGLPLGTAAAVGILLSRLNRVLAWALCALLLAAGFGAAQQVLADRDPLPGLVGRELASHTQPADVILTNYACNPLVPGGTGDEYVLLRPEVSWYSDRVVRGGIATAAGLLEARARRPDAGWFLLTPWPATPAEELQREVLSVAAAPAVQLSDEPRVLLVPLKR